MIRQNYLQEVGIGPVEKTVRWPFAIVILVTLFAGLGYLTKWGNESYLPHSRQTAQAAVVAHKPINPIAPLNASAKIGSDTNRHGVT